MNHEAVIKFMQKTIRFFEQCSDHFPSASNTLRKLKHWTKETPPIVTMWTLSDLISFLIALIIKSPAVQQQPTDQEIQAQQAKEELLKKAVEKAAKYLKGVREELESTEASGFRAQFSDLLNESQLLLDESQLLLNGYTRKKTHSLLQNPLDNTEIVTEIVPLISNGFTR